MNLTEASPLLKKQPRLHFLCGKIASGKSTLAKQLANLPRTILLCEDEWLAALYPNEITELAHYVEKSALVKQVLEGHIRQLIQAGNNIVMDFPANTPIQRQWLMSLAQSSDVSYVFHVLQVSNDECKARLAARNLAGENPFQTSETQFDLITAHFSYPTSSERLICKFYP
ncbi:AAA family ATPase [Providencia hangzhouensis]|uniref:ATP-binding protein n=1 Tax=Providencia rettgeri TaxID=587 RepID=A0AAE2ZIF1_PRORE|nr:MULTISPECIES: ATP-binding protein [Providencia]MBG5893712.1 ATP-binding protein [Providencia rettgeri]MBI6191005.1 ATP-binding protein [Providencia rettgeri]MBW3104321.1 ATP-binding protein [Providencia rettgeri]MBW3117385.1 ATP-binding protein [Providencia rettgeri]MCG9528858.1 ATP-binding protein [Providencia rettgeri]